MACKQYASLSQAQGIYDVLRTGLLQYLRVALRNQCAYLCRYYGQQRDIDAATKAEARCALRGEQIDACHHARLQHELEVQRQARTS